MDNQTVSVESRWTTRKIIRACLIIMILVLFPLVSWMYLRGGIEFRKEALAALAEKASIGQVYLQTTNSKEYILGAGNKRVFACFLVSDLTDQAAINSITAYQQQFDATGEVEVLIFSIDGQVPNELKQSEMYLLDSEQAANAAFLDQLKSASSTSDVFLLDKEGNLRNFYEYDGEKAFRNLVTHTAVLIPPNNNRSVRQKNKSEL